MKIEKLKTAEHEEVLYAEEASACLRAIIAIHSTARGPACGGIRLLPYASRVDALEDVLRLSRGMSYKSAIAGLGFGGGKSVILARPGEKSPALFQAFGDFLNTLDGKYIAAKDMGIEASDLKQVRTRSRHVLGIDGEPGSSGDPSPVTARGILRAIEACSQLLQGTRELRGLRLAIQGLGHVGYDIARRAHAAGAKVFATDTNLETLRRVQEELGVTVVEPQEIYSISCDVFSPCARGAVLNENTIPRLKCRAVVGCANNQLATPLDGQRLHDREILYAPDFVVNSGGIINIYVEYTGYSQSRAFDLADGIYNTTLSILEDSRRRGLAPSIIADEMAKERLRGQAR